MAHDGWTARTEREQRPADGRDTGPLLGLPDTAAVLRWAATVAWIVCLGWFMYVLGAEVGAWAAAFAGLVLLGAPMVALWVGHFRREGEREDLAAGRDRLGGQFDAGPEPGRPPGVIARRPEEETEHYGAVYGGTSLTAGPGRDDGHAAPPWAGADSSGSQGAAIDDSDD